MARDKAVSGSTAGDRQRRVVPTHLLRRQKADINEVPVVGYQGYHFKGQVGPWVLGDPPVKEESRK